MTSFDRARCHLVISGHPALENSRDPRSHHTFFDANNSTTKTKKWLKVLTMDAESPASYASARQDDVEETPREPTVIDGSPLETPLHPNQLFPLNSVEFQRTALDGESSFSIRRNDEVEDDTDLISKEKAENLLLDVNMDEVAADDQFNPSDDESGGSNEDAVELEEAAEEELCERINTVIKLEDDTDKHVMVIQKDGLVIDVTDDIKLPEPDPSWKPPKRKVKNGEPEFSEVDNPMNWPRYCYKPFFKKKGPFDHYGLPTGCMPVPYDDKLKGRISNGWHFHYDRIPMLEILARSEEPCSWYWRRRCIRYVL